MSRALMGYVEVIERGNNETLWSVVKDFLKKIW